MASAAYSLAASDRGMFDPNLPVQGIFDPNIFDTQLAVALDQILLPVFVHGRGDITAAVHGREAIIVK